MDNSAYTSLSSASLSTPVSTVVSGRITPVIYNVAVGTKSQVSALPNVVTSSTSPSPGNGSLKTATVSPSVTSALIQWLAGMQHSQQNKASSPSPGLPPGETTPGPLRPVINPPVTEITAKEFVNQKKLMNVNVKVLNSEKLKDCPVYVLRNVDEGKLSTRHELVKELQNQFGTMIPETTQLPIGYFKGSTKITIRADADIADVWEYIRKGCQVSLWCQGNNPAGESSESEDELPPKKRQKGTKKKLSALEEKSNRVERQIYTLKKRHGDEYNSIQYRLWAEMLDIGTHRYS